MPKSPTVAAPLFLGLDTGGTYTDAVLWSETGGLVAKAKALTTRHDLAVGIAGAVDAVLAATGVDPAAVKLVSMSTTLATNALVEGQGDRAALVMIGFGEADLARDGLKAALGSDPVIFCPGGHDVFGTPFDLVLDPLEASLPHLATSVAGFALCGQFAVRNPAHELAVAELIRLRTGLPVTTSHELSSKLGGPKRALTTLLNARLISMIDRLVSATEAFLVARGIAAPLMVVRGDGALVSAAFARARPIETILSGPAASLVGASHLTGLASCVVSDIGGTTTDIAILDAGRPRLDPTGASIGGYRTMVEAVAVRTFGLGGDSDVTLLDGSLEPRLRLGPRRVIPLSLAAMTHGEAILGPLRHQLGAGSATRLDGRFALRTGVPDRMATGLTGSEEALFATITLSPHPLSRLLTASADHVRLTRLVARGLVHVVGFTPSDAAHVLGRQTNWNGEAAMLGARLFARLRDGRGMPLAASPQQLAERVLADVTRRSAEAIFETAFAEDGLDGPDLIGHVLTQRALEHRPGIARIAIALDRPVVGVGASAGLHYAGLEPLVGNRCIVPADTDVANAIGAVVGQVRIRVEGKITLLQDGGYRVALADGVADLPTEDEALVAAEAGVRRLAAQEAAAAGTDAAEIEISRMVRTAVVEGHRHFVDADIVATATGRPRIAV